MERILDKIESSAYKEMLENSETYNTRLCIERRLRMPFIDPQTGVAQNNCALYMKCRQRMPGFRDGQLYTYPSARWRKSRRQYLARPFRMLKEPADVIADSEFSLAGDSTSIGIVDTDSKDSHHLKEDVAKEWYYDEMDLHDMDGFEDQDPDSDFEEPYSMRKSKGKKGRNEGGSSGGGAGGGASFQNSFGGGRRSKGSALPSSASETPKKGTSRRGRKTKNLDGDQSGSASPMHSSGVGGTGKKSRHSMHNQHLMHDDHSNSSFIMQMDAQATPQSPQHGQAGGMAGAAPGSHGRFSHLDHFGPGAHHPSDPHGQGPPNAGGGHHGPPFTPGGAMGNPGPGSAVDSGGPAGGAAPGSGREAGGGGAAGAERDHTRRTGEKAKPSPYCDFCLGDARENKKTGSAEELVSCSDCGRSGHPTCLQFTANMMISVKRYRWQCIECKYCSICGTSDNDDQLLFCDDCDRGYHMYCLSPALTAPPEGSWSCKLCIEEFHTPKSNPTIPTSVAAAVAAAATGPPTSDAAPKTMPPAGPGPVAPPPHSAPSNSTAPSSSLAASNSIISQQLQQPPVMGPAVPPPVHGPPPMPYGAPAGNSQMPTTIMSSPMHPMHHGGPPPHPMMHPQPPHPMMGMHHPGMPPPLPHQAPVGPPHASHPHGPPTTMPHHH